MTISSWAFLLVVCASTILPKGTSTTSSFRLQIRHVDAKANITMAERLSRAAGRTHHRLTSFSGVSARVRAPSYVAEYAIGNPPQFVLAMVDSMSDLVWTQSSTCHPRCFAQELRYYNSSSSFTDHPVPCDHSMCAAGYETKPCMGGGSGNDDAGTCPVRASFYGDIAGDLRTEEFRFGPAVVNLSFGDMSEINTTYYLGGASGVLGLGRGNLSLVSQVLGKRFSYCLTRFVDHVDSSPLFVGSSAGLSGNAPVTTTQFHANPPDEPFSSFYYLPLTQIKFEGQEGYIGLPQGAFRIRHRNDGMWTGGVVIGTNSPFMYLVDVAYRALRHELSWLLGSSLVQSPVDGLLEMCVAREDVSSIVPALVLNFGSVGGAELVLRPENYWATIDTETSCMVVVSSATIGTRPWNETTMIGSFMQQNMNVLYDLENDNISFQAADCATI